MEKVYTIECTWQLNKNPKGQQNGRFSGQFFCEGNLAKGIVYCDGDSTPNIVVGTFIKDKGLEITKISTKNADTVTITVLKNGEDYTGDLFLETQFGANIIGKCNADIKQQSFFVADAETLKIEYRNAKKHIAELNGLGNYLLSFMESPANISKREQKIEQLSKNSNHNL